MYKQVRAFNIANAGTTKYMCLSNVRKGYGIPAKYAYAWLDWSYNLKQHRDQNFPAGVAVPVYFSFSATLDGIYRNWGHIAVRLPDGRIWTDGRYYASVTQLQNNYLSNGAYQGWGESVNNVRVVQEVQDMATINDDVSRQIGFHYLGRNGKDGKANALGSKQGDIFGKPLTNAQLSTFFLSAESRDWRDNRLNRVYAERDALKAANTNLNTVNTQLTKAVAEKEATIQKQGVVITEQQAVINGQKIEIAELSDANAKLKEQLALCGNSEDTDNLNKLGEVLRWLLVRLGLRG